MANFSGLPSAKKLKEFKKISPQYFDQIKEQYKESNPEYYEKVIKPIDYSLPTVRSNEKSIIAIIISISILIVGIALVFFIAFSR